MLREMYSNVPIAVFRPTDRLRPPDESPSAGSWARRTGPGGARSSMVRSIRVRHGSGTRSHEWH